MEIFVATVFPGRILWTLIIIIALVTWWLETKVLRIKDAVCMCTSLLGWCITKRRRGAVDSASDSLGWCITKRRRGAVDSVSDSWSVDTSQSWVRAPSKAPAVSLSKKLYSHCLVLVGSRNGFERDLHKQIMACFTIKLKQISINYHNGIVVNCKTRVCKLEYQNAERITSNGITWSQFS